MPLFAIKAELWVISIDISILQALAKSRYVPNSEDEDSKGIFGLYLEVLGRYVKWGTLPRPKESQGYSRLEEQRALHEEQIARLTGRTQDL